MSSGENKAVFLSYASQDAEAARRICEALRASGVEVWFDQNELVGGDAWDAKIRRQIKDCALFVPIISANTQARTEGYFRLEWRLADQRTHLMGKTRSFLVPVCIDDTPDAEADVPDSFLSVQWTRLRGGETPASFCQRVNRLLSGAAAPAPAGSSMPPRTEGAAKEAPIPARRGRKALWFAVTIAALLAGFAVWRPWRSVTPRSTPAARPAPTATTELGRAWERVQPDRWQKQDFDAISATVDRLIQANPEEPAAWALRSIIHSLQVMRNFDSGTKPLELGKSAAERALRLAPGSLEGELALGMHLAAMFSRGGDVRSAQPHLARALAGLPRNALTRYAELTTYWLGYQFEETHRSATAWLAEEPRASFPAWILAQFSVARRQPDDAEKWAELAAADSDITGIRARVTQFEARYFLRADVPGAWKALETLPAGARPPHRLLFARWLLAMAERKWDQALQEVARIPEPILFDRNYHGPKALLAALAHQAAGRTGPAMSQLQEAERLLRAELAPDPDNEELHAVLAVTLASARRAEEARAELAAIEPLMLGRAPCVYTGGMIALIAQAHAALGDAEKAAPWLRKLLAEPSALPFTPASLKLDPRFGRVISHPAVQALLTEFAALDQSGKSAQSAEQKSVAVLPFVNQSTDRDNEYFSDGVADELLTVLQKIPGLRVAARTSAWSFKGKNPTAQEVGERLGMAHVVEGTVQKSGNRVKITARLSRAATNEELWSRTFGPLELTDVFATQNEIAQAIVGELRGRLTGETSTAAKAEIQAQVSAAARGGTKNPEAHELYLRGKFLANQWSLDAAVRASELLRRALQLDPKFALGWAALARASSVRAGFGDTLRDFEEGNREAREAAERALALEPDLAAAHVELAFIACNYDFDWRRAAASIARAQQLAPNDPTVLDAAAYLADARGELDRAIAYAEQALQLDPISPVSRLQYCNVLSKRGRFADAAEQQRRVIEWSPGTAWAHGGLAINLLWQGQADAALAALAKEPSRWVQLYVGSLIHWDRRDVAASDATLADLIKSYADICAFQIGEVYGYRGDADRAFDWLERALRQHDSGLVGVKTDYTLRKLHADPRWPAFLKKMGLADEQLK